MTKETNCFAAVCLLLLMCSTACCYSVGPNHVQCVENQRMNCMRCICRRGQLNCYFDRTLCVRPRPVPKPQSCTLEGRVIEHGSSSLASSCEKTCYCNNGELQCDRLICPESKPCHQGQAPVKIDIPGECCPSFTCEATSGEDGSQGLLIPILPDQDGSGIVTTPDQDDSQGSEDDSQGSATITIPDQDDSKSLLFGSPIISVKESSFHMDPQGIYSNRYNHAIT